LKQLLLRNFAVDFVEICNVYVGKMIIEAAKRIFNSDKICRSYSDLNFGVTFFGTQCIYTLFRQDMKRPSVDDAYYPTSKRQAVETRDQSSSFNYNVYQSSR